MRNVFVLVLISCFTVSAQSAKTNHYKDLTGNGEVFFNALISGIQNRTLPPSDTAITFLDSAISYYSTEPGNYCNISSAYAVKARMYNWLGRKDSAAKYYLAAAKLIKADCPDFNRYYLFNSWAILQETMGEYRLADSLYTIALDASMNLENKTYELNVLTNQSNSLSKQKKLKLAVGLMKQIKQMAWDYDIYYHKLSSLQNLGAYYINLEYYDSAKYNLLALEGLVNDTTPSPIVMDMYNNLGVVNERLGDLEEAKSYYYKAIVFAQLENQPNKLLIYLNNYAYIQHALGNYDEAWKYINQYMGLKDSLFNLEKYGTVKKLETQYRTALQREEILAQKLELETQKRNRNIMIFALSGLFFILIAVYSRLRYVRRSKTIVEKEKKRSEELLLNILPEEVAEELKETGQSKARTLRNVTVLFTDFKDFTSISAKLSAEQMVEEINFYFKRFDEIVAQYDIEKIKTIGDSFMAAAGVPIEQADAAKNAILAAIDMLEVVTDRNVVNARMDKPIFDMRIGINTGPVVAGIVGIKKFQYDIWGDTVNTASRMESFGEIGKVNISHSTYELLKDDPEFVFEPRGFVEVKGKGKLEMWFVSKAS